MQQAHPDPQLKATLQGRRPLYYIDGADKAQDRPAHVRAGSALVHVGTHWIVIQDDALFLAHLHPDGPIHAESLPSKDGVRQFDTLRGNKHDKLDLEAACLWPAPDGERLLAWGSGSSPAREQLLIAAVGRPPITRHAGPLYAALRAALPGVELNVEGAWRTRDGHLRLLQRGNGGGACDAMIEVDGAFVDGLLAERPASPTLRRLDRWSLGALRGVRLTWTDAMARDSAWLFAAAAEDSPDAIDDGPVLGSALGWCDDAQARWTPLTDASGQPLVDKVEGLAPGAAPDEVLLVTDPDDPERPAELLRVRLDGPWPR